MRVLLIDGTNLVMRYAFAMVPAQFMDPGNPGALLEPHEVERVLKAVEKAIRECAIPSEATHAIIALDSGLPGERHALYPEYKAKRQQTTNIWSNRLHMYLTARGFLCLRAPGFEADDIIATLAARIGRAGATCAVLSGDSDLLQLASLWCDVFQFGGPNEPRFICRSMAWIAQRYEIANSGLLMYYKALVGEPGDGIPGCKGIGRVKAAALLETAKTPEEIKATGRVDPAQFDLMLELVRLREDVPLDPVQPATCRLPLPLEPAI